MDILRATFSALNGTPAKDAALYIADEGVGKKADWVIKQAVFTASEQAFRADGLKSKPSKAATLKNISFATLEKPVAVLKQALDQAIATVHGIDLAKTLVIYRATSALPVTRAKALALGKNSSHQDHGAGRKRHAEIGHGFIPLRHARYEQAPSSSRWNTTRRQKTKTYRTGRQSITFDSGVFRSSPVPKWMR